MLICNGIASIVSRGVREHEPDDGHRDHHPPQGESESAESHRVAPPCLRPIRHPPRRRDPGAANRKVAGKASRVNVNNYKFLYNTIFILFRFSYNKGVYAFSRIADELGRKRPDIALLVVEGRGTRRTPVDCGIDLRVHGSMSTKGNGSGIRPCRIPGLVIVS
jgi:hypothetical protein